MEDWFVCNFFGQRTPQEVKSKKSLETEIKGYIFMELYVETFVKFPVAFLTMMLVIFGALLSPH